MCIMKTFKRVLFFLLLGMTAVSVARAELFPGMQPLEEGIIQYVDLQTGELVVNDTAYRLHDGTSVRRSNGAVMSLKSLRKGLAVRLHLNPAVLEAASEVDFVNGVELR